MDTGVAARPEHMWRMSHIHGHVGAAGVKANSAPLTNPRSRSQEGGRGDEPHLIPLAKAPQCLALATLMEEISGAHKRQAMFLGSF